MPWNLPVNYWKHYGHMDEEAVAAGVERAHEEISILQYNDENSLKLHHSIWHFILHRSIIR